MQPGLSSGDRLIFSSFMLPSWINRVKNDENVLPFKRGSIVLVDMRRSNNRNAALRVIDGIVRFFTAQSVSIFSDGQYYIKRVIALPGDEISMSNYVFRVKVQGSPYSLTEFELSEKPYHPEIPQIPQLWDESVPFSGSMDTIILGPDECFVVSDDRGNTNDSRTWGTISPSLITARAVLRFWPVMKINLL
jgi:signal peptidase I